MASALLLVTGAWAQTLLDTCPPIMSATSVVGTTYQVTYSCPSLVVEQVYIDWIYVSNIDGTILDQGICEIDACVGPYVKNEIPEFLKRSTDPQPAVAADLRIPPYLKRPYWQRRGPEPVPMLYTPVVRRA